LIKIASRTYPLRERLEWQRRLPRVARKLGCASGPPPRKHTRALLTAHLHGLARLQQENIIPLAVTRRPPKPDEADGRARDQKCRDGLVRDHARAGSGRCVHHQRLGLHARGATRAHKRRAARLRDLRVLRVKAELLICMQRPKVSWATQVGWHVAGTLRGCIGLQLYLPAAIILSSSV
jgi:hypothetical protein